MLDPTMKILGIVHALMMFVCVVDVGMKLVGMFGVTADTMTILTRCGDGSSLAYCLRLKSQAFERLLANVATGVREF